MDYSALPGWPVPPPGRNSFTDHYSFSPAPLDHAHGLWVTEIGFHMYHSRMAGDDLRSRPVWTCLFMAAGSGFIRLGGNQGRLEPGGILILPPWRIHAYGSERPWSSVFVHFGGVRASRLVGRIAASRWPLVNDPRPGEAWALLKGMILECRRRRQATQPVLAVGLTQLLHRIREHWRPGGMAAPSGDSQRVKVVQEWLRTNLAGSVTVSEMAARAGCSPSYFSRLWKRHTGSAPLDYVIDLRLLRARGLLSRTSLSIRAIAEKTGFEDQLYFSRLFRRRIGLPPSTYRENTRLR